MSLKREEINELKNQLKEQVRKLPEDKREEAEKQIDEMSDEAIEEMLEQQKTQKIFRMIANKEIDSVIVEESNEALAVLEINPLSKGHLLIVPKERMSDKKVFLEKIGKFTDKLKDKIERSLKTKKVHIIVENKLGEIIGEIVPEYDISMKDMKRISAQKEDLEKIKGEINREIISVKKEIIKEEKKEEVPKEKPLKIRRPVP